MPVEFIHDQIQPTECSMREAGKAHLYSTLGLGQCNDDNALWGYWCHKSQGTCDLSNLSDDQRRRFLDWKNRRDAFRARMKRNINSRNADDPRHVVRRNFKDASTDFAILIAKLGLHGAMAATQGRTGFPVLHRRDGKPSKLYDAVAIFTRNEQRMGVEWERLSFMSDLPGQEVKTAWPLFPHVSEKDPGKVAYYESLSKYERDIQTPISPGKFIKKFWPSISDKEIQAIVERHVRRDAERRTLKFIENDDQDGWLHVYENGPDSCMHGEECVKVYAYKGNHLRLAYLEFDGKIWARAIVREDKKTYVRAYPNPDDDEFGGRAMYETMVSSLEAAGYSRGNMNGIKLAAIESSGGDYLMPYIDRGESGYQDVEFHGDHFEVVYDGISATETCGYIEVNNTECSHCGGRIDSEDDEYTTVDGYTICYACYQSDYVDAETRYGCTEICPIDDCFEVLDEDGDTSFYVYEPHQHHVSGYVYVESEHAYYEEDAVIYDSVSCEHVLYKNAEEDCIDGEYYSTDNLVELVDWEGDTRFCLEKNLDEAVRTFGREGEYDPNAIDEDDIDTRPLASKEQLEAAGQQRLPLPADELIMAA